MKKFSLSNAPETLKLKKDQLSRITGGAGDGSDGTVSMCMADGAIEPNDNSGGGGPRQI